MERDRVGEGGSEGRGREQGREGGRGGEDGVRGRNKGREQGEEAREEDSRHLSANCLQRTMMDDRTVALMSKETTHLFFCGSEEGQLQIPTKKGREKETRKTH